MAKRSAPAGPEGDRASACPAPLRCQPASGGAETQGRHLTESAAEDAHTPSSTALGVATRQGGREAAAAAARLQDEASLGHLCLDDGREESLRRGNWAG